MCDKYCHGWRWPETSHSSLSETCPPQKNPQVTTSDVWEFFEKLPDAITLANISSWNTHYSISQRLKQTTLFDHTKRSQCSEAHKGNITSLILDMVATDLRTLRLDESEGLMKYLELGLQQIVVFGIRIFAQFNERISGYSLAFREILS